MSTNIYSKINTQPYDFIVSGLAAVAAVETTLASGSEKMVKVFDDLNKKSYTGYNGYLIPDDGVWEYSWDVARNGTAIGNHTLTGPTLPPGFSINHANWIPRVAIGSTGSAQISFGTAAATPTNILGAAVLGTHGTVGRKACVPILTTANSAVRITAATKPVIGITVEALNAGSGKLTILGNLDVQDNVTV